MVTLAFKNIILNVSQYLISHQTFFYKLTRRLFASGTDWLCPPDFATSGLALLKGSATDNRRVYYTYEGSIEAEMCLKPLYL